MTMTEAFDPLSSHFEQNPYQELKRMREAGPAYRHQGTLMPVVSVFRNADVRAMAQDWKSWSSQRSAEYNEKALGDAAILIGNDPPLHTKYRDIVAPLFMPGAVAPLVGLIEEQTALVVDKCLGQGEINFVEDFAANATVAVICSIVGVPEADRPKMRQMTLDIAKADGRPVFWKETDQDTLDRIARMMADMTAYFTEHTERRRREPTDDILSTIATQITEPRHLIGLSLLMVAAGNETTTNLMAHGLQELLRHPDQLALLRAHPELMSQAVEEMLRYRGTVRKMDRIATAHTTIGDVEIHPGESVALWNASASRDPEAIDRPEEFDITRRPNRHLAFGSGIHMCIGNALARLELKIAFRQLLERTRHIELTRGDDSYESWQNGVLECGKRLSVQLIPA
jgi:cytochrome P450